MQITEWAQRKSIVVMSNRDSQCIDTGFIATGKRQRGNNYFTNNEVEDDFLNTRGENSPISTQPNLHFAQEPPPIQPSISASRREETQLNCASIVKKSDSAATHNESSSLSAAVKTFEQLQGFSKGDFVIAGTIFVNNAGVREVFLSCNEENKAPWIKAMIDQHKAKQKRPWEELEQDANQNQPQSKLARRISSMGNRRKRPWEELEQDANQNQPQSKLVRLISSMENQPQSCQIQVGMIRIFKARSALRFAFIMIGISKRQYDIEEAVPTLRTQTLHIEEWPAHKLVFANQVPQSIYTGRNITDNDDKPIQIQLIDINTGRQCTNVAGLNIKVDIVVIDGDLEQEGLDSDKFNSKIVKRREGKRPLLVGNTEVTFNQQGVGTTGDICFTDNSSWLRSRKFRLGACIDSKRCGTNIKIQEGLSEKFVVKDQRGLLYEKHYPPMLNDKVWRLEGIAKNGKYQQRLKEKTIKSVQDFLKSLNANPSVLKEILDMQPNAWKKVVKHARTCRMEPDLANLDNNADLPKSPGLEPFTPNPMPEFQQENMEVVMNVPVPTVDLLHAPEIQAQYMVRPISIGMGMGQQRDPAARFGSDQMEYLHPISSLNGNNGPSEAGEEMPEQPSAGQGMTMENDIYCNQGYHISIDDYISSDFSHMTEIPGLEFQISCSLPKNMGMGNQVAPESNTSFNGNNEPISSNLHADEIFDGLSEQSTAIPNSVWIESYQWDL
ncbi:Protein SAR DEFICIENT 1 [Carex littledalei]|uniref:Protein SAR DEFICIENT 1 n=1 Tax=Carex littledalei TaxID=544730 RepID=A0A833RMJ5_9POAL|nr:Protein SAR DEFICIENT 1 [Carex littledalei]